MLKLSWISVALILAIASASCWADGPIAFKKIRLEDQFYAEGAYYADFNHDGKLDVVAGPFWYEGPAFEKKHEVRPPQSFDPKGYSDNFLTFTGDFNGDGWADIFYAPWPGKEGYWYENPAGKDAAWKQHLAFGCVDNESPMWGDVNLDGRPDLVFNTDGYLGYATYDPAKPDEAWQFHAITPKGSYHKYTHGIGFGDVNNDGRTDILEGNGWWEQPANAAEGQTWTLHPFKFADAAAQMFAYDVDGDGLKDVITAWHCHHVRDGLVSAAEERSRRDFLATARDPAVAAGYEQQRLAGQPAARHRVGGHERRRTAGRVDRQAVLGARPQRRCRTRRPGDGALV